MHSRRKMTSFVSVLNFKSFNLSKLFIEKTKPTAIDVVTITFKYNIKDKIHQGSFKKIIAHIP